jgi:hypothetical protein
MARSVTSSSRKEMIADVAGLFSLNLRGRSAGIVPVDGCLGHATFISIVGNAQYLAQAKFLREAQWANEVSL